MVNLVQKSHERYGLPDCKFFVSIDDVPMALSGDNQIRESFNNRISFNYWFKDNSSVIPFPCFAFDKWKDAGVSSYETFYSDMVTSAFQAKWKERSNRMFWAGAIENHPFRKEFYTTFENKKNNFDLVAINWNTSNGQQQCRGFVPMNDICKYRYALDIEGSGYSARLKYLFLTGSTVCHVERNYTNDFFLPEFVNGVDYVNLKKDFSNTLPLFDQSNEKDMEIVAENGFNKACDILKPDNIYYNISEGMKLIYQLTKKNDMIGRPYQF